MRSISRVLGVSINAISRLLVEAGQVCSWLHDTRVKDVSAQHVECDEIWSFCFAKEANAPNARGVLDKAGDLWCWTGIDRETKLLVSFRVGARDADTANDFVKDLESRLANRIQLTTDGWSLYLDAVADAFGQAVD